jgi:hypothetical protein
MRVAIVDPYYQAFLDQHYAARPELADAGYAEQHAALMGRCFGTFDAYSRHLRALGHEAIELVPNCAPLQERWAAEHGVRLGSFRLLTPLGTRLGARVRQRRLQRAVRAQLDEFAPDVVYLQSLTAFSPDELAAQRRAGRLVVGQIASPAPVEPYLRQYDLIVSSFPHFVERFQRMGIDSAYLPLGFDGAILDRLAATGCDVRPPSARPVDVVFVGGLDPAIHAQGTALLEDLAASFDLGVWGYGADRLPPGSALRRRYRGEAWGLDMYAAFAGARIVINRHIDVAESYANNMRLFEATGTGAVLVTDRKENLADLFDVGTEIVDYDGVEELTQRLMELVADDAACDSIAAAGQRRTLARHGYDRRMAELAALLEHRVARESPSVRTD